MKSEQVTQEQTIGERMATRQASAIEKIRSMLWDGGDIDSIAAVALANAVEPKTVDKLAVQVAEAKTALQIAVEADKALPELEAVMVKAEAEAKKAATALKVAEEADENARMAWGSAEEAVIQARQAREGAARRIDDGTLPKAHAPEFALAIADAWRQTQEKQVAESRRVTLKQQVRWLTDRIEGLTSELKREKGADPKMERVVPGAGGSFVKLQDVIKHRLKTEKENLATAEAELAELETSAA